MVVAVEYISKEESADAETAKHGVTGILAVQGAFAEHAAMLDKLGAQWKLLRAAEDFDDSIDRVILSGGESTSAVKPVSVSTSVGMANSIFRVLRSSRLASRASTGLIT